MKKNKDYTIYCPRCGSEMKSSSRYCMKCGYLSTDHPQNKNMLKYIKDNEEQYSVSKIKNNNPNADDLVVNLGFKVCFLLNIITFFSIMLIVILTSYFNTGNFDFIFSDDIAFSFIMISISYLYIYANELLFMKLGYSWWESLIPIYNVFLLSKRVFGNASYGLFIFIPIIGEIYILILYYRLAGKFNKSGLLMILFPMIMIPVIGYGSSFYENNIKINEDLEYKYKMKRGFLILSLLFLFIGIVIMIYNSGIITETINKLMENWKEYGL